MATGSSSWGFNSSLVDRNGQDTQVRIFEPHGLGVDRRVGVVDHGVIVGKHLECPKQGTLQISRFDDQSNVLICACGQIHTVVPRDANTQGKLIQALWPPEH